MILSNWYLCFYRSFL